MVLFVHSRGGKLVAWFMANFGNPRVTRLVPLAPTTWDTDRATKGHERRLKQPLSGVVARAGELMAKEHGATMMDDGSLL